MGQSTGAADNGNGGRAHADRARIVYSERLYLAWWAWPIPLVLAAAIAMTVHQGYPGLRAWLPYVVVVPAVIGVIALLSRTPVRVLATNSEHILQVAGARLPARFVDSVETISAGRKRKALGPELDPAAYIMHRGWVGPILRVSLRDPDDPTPHWLFSTRRPEKLAELLREVAARDSSQADVSTRATQSFADRD